MPQTDDGRSRFTNDDRLAVVDARVRQLETERYSHHLNASLLRASAREENEADAEALGETERQIAELDCRLAALAGQRGKLATTIGIESDVERRMPGLDVEQRLEIIGSWEANLERAAWDIELALVEMEAGAAAPSAEGVGEDPLAEFRERKRIIESSIKALQAERKLLVEPAAAVKKVAANNGSGARVVGAKKAAPRKRAAQR